MLRIGNPLWHDNWITAAAFSPDGQVVLTGSNDKTTRLGEVAPTPAKGTPEQIILWPQVLTGREADERGGICFLDAATWCERRRRLDELDGPPAGTEEP